MWISLHDDIAVKKSIRSFLLYFGWLPMVDSKIEFHQMIEIFISFQVIGINRNKVHAILEYKGFKASIKSFTQSFELRDIETKS